MIKKQLFFYIVFFVFVCSVSYAQVNIGGAIDDSFKKDYRNVPFPRDKNAQLIDNKELLENLF